MKDLLLDENFDITNNIGEATDQMVSIALLTNKGVVKNFPHAGISLAGYLKSTTSKGRLEITIKKELELDNAVVEKVHINNQGNIDIKATWKK